MTEEEIETEATALWRDFYPARWPGTLMRTLESQDEATQAAFRAMAIGAFKRRKTVGGPIDPDPPELPGA